MQRLQKTIIVMTAAVCFTVLAMCLVGCTEDQLAQVDGLAKVAEDVGNSVDQVLDSPVGSMIPQPINGIVRLAGEAVLALCGLWFANKARVRGVVLRSVVQAVDGSANIKDTVKSNLRAAGVEVEGRKIINEYREAG